MIRAGRVLAGRYALEQLLGAGGMGQVWIARHQTLDRFVAVKLMTPEALSSKVLRARFEREAKACAQLRSPHVVQVFDYGVEEDIPYLVMELLEGEDLATLLQRSASWSLREVASVVAQAAKGLAEAHQMGIVHRDIKLSNLFMARVAGEKIVKVLDFGIAKALEDPGPKMTMTNATLGSPSYMSPEQALSKPVDRRSDLWSLGVVTFRLITGEPPFKADSPLLVAQKIVRGQRSRVADVVDGLPPAIDAFFDVALAMSPDARFQSADDLAAELTRIAATAPEAAARPRGSGPVASAAAAAPSVAAPVVDPTEASPPESRTSLVSIEIPAPTVRASVTSHASLAAEPTRVSATNEHPSFDGEPSLAEDLPVETRLMEVKPPAMTRRMSTVAPAMRHTRRLPPSEASTLTGVGPGPGDPGPPRAAPPLRAIAVVSVVATATACMAAVGWWTTRRDSPPPDAAVVTSSPPHPASEPPPQGIRPLAEAPVAMESASPPASSAASTSAPAAAETSAASSAAARATASPSARATGVVTSRPRPRAKERHGVLDTAD